MIIDVENDSIIPVIERWLTSLKGIISITTKRKGRSTTSKVQRKSAKTDAATEDFVKRFCGKLPDNRSADEIIADIYASRVNKDESFVENAFK